MVAFVLVRGLPGGSVHLWPLGAGSGLGYA